MKNRLTSFALGLLCCLLFSFSACAQLKITASITVTNKTTNGMTFTLNGDTRTFTNNVVNPLTQVATNADTTGCGSKTNLLTQIQLTRFSQVQPINTGSNSFNLVGNADLPMSLTISAGYASVSYSTQLVTDMVLAQVPVSGLPTAQSRTNVASGIVGGINAAENTNQIDQNSTAAAQLMGLANSQTISGIKKITNAASQFFGIISNSPAISGTAVLIAGGLYTSPIIASPTLTNGVNYGSAFSSPGTTGLFSEQFGHSAIANADNSTAVGNAANAIGGNSTAVGTIATASGTGTVAIGNIASAVGEHSIAIGDSSDAEAPGSTAIGQDASVSPTHTNSTAIGVGATTTAPNQTVIGAPGINTVIQNNLNVQTNLDVAGNTTLHGLTTNQTWIGTNNFGANADIAFAQKSVTSLANGNNADVPIGTNVVIVVSGPTGAFTINGISGGRDGKIIIIKNKTGQVMTIANQSGVEPTAANRIRTGEVGDFSNSSNPGIVTLEYDGADSRWDLVSFNNF
jgi:hypothetical protein